MASNKFLTWLLEKPLNIDPSKAGKTLLGLNAVGIGAAALSNTFAAAIDKDTSAEDKKFLVPAGFATGVANLAVYFTMTTAIIDKLQGKVKYNKDGSVKKTIRGFADDVLEKMDSDTFNKNALNYVDKTIKKAETGFMGTGLFKKSADYVQSMKNTLKNENGQITDAAKNLFKSNFKSGFGVLGAFIGAVIGSAILTPIIRDVSAYFVQKQMEKKNPELKEKPYMPYFEPTRIASARYDVQMQKQPLNMKTFMISTKGGALKI